MVFNTTFNHISIPVHKFHRETLGYKIYITNFWGDISNVDPSKRVTAIAVS
jgi:hypothetical protein